MTTDLLPLTKQLLGTWTLVSHELRHRDGRNSLTYGASPKGVAVFDAGVVSLFQQCARIVPSTRLATLHRVQPRRTNLRPKGP
jgi:hypothetical protein